MRMSRVRPAVAFLVGSLLIACSAFAQPYKLIDLGHNVLPTGVNDSDVVVGALGDASTPIGRVPFIWRGGVLTPIDVPGNWTWGHLSAINSAGTAVGAMTHGDPPLEMQTPFIYRDGVVTFIPLSGDFTTGYPFAINDSGVIVGSMAGIGAGSASFFYQDGVTTFLPPGCGVIDISSTGVAAGTAMSPYAASQQACVWENSAMRLLPGGDFSYAAAISDSGAVLGTMAFAPDFAPHMVVWENDIARDLGGVPDAVFTQGYDINNSGMVVGYAVFGPAPARTGAFLYRDSAFATLDSIMGPSTGWHFDIAIHINQRGDIVGYGLPPGTTEMHGYLLVAQKTTAEIAAELTAAIAADGLRPSQAQSLLSLLHAYEQSGGANRRGLCNALDRFIRNAPGFGLTAQQTDELIGLASSLREVLGC